MCDQKNSQDEDDIQLTNIENLFNRLQNQGLKNDEIRLVEEQAEQLKKQTKLHLTQETLRESN